MATTTEKKRTGPSARRTTTRPNRAQLQAAEIRAAESGAVAVATAPRVVSTVNLRGKTAARGFVLSREAEMEYVRQDLKRLLLVSGGLFVLMIGLLLILD